MNTPGAHPSPSPPAIDLAYLRTATFGNAALEAEVLRLFQTQAAGLRDVLEQTPHQVTAIAIHSIKGAARGVGAGQVAVAAADLEVAAGPDRQADGIRLLAERLREAEAAIARHLVAPAA